MKRTGFKRRETPLARGSSSLKRSRIRKRKPRGQPAERSDREYLAWLRRQPCRMCGRPWTPRLPNEAHHPRRDADGPVGTGLKAADRLALTLCATDVPEGRKGCHDHRTDKTGPFSGWSKDEVADWEREKGAAQRALYERLQREEQEGRLAE